MKAQTVILILVVIGVGYFMYKMAQPKTPTDLAGIMQYFGYDQATAQAYMKAHGL